MGVLCELSDGGRIMKNSEIVFKAQDNHVWEVRQKPEPASQFVPQWWKNLPIYSNKERKFSLDPHPTVTVKRCAPVLDSLTSGYIIPLWTDIWVTQQNGFPLVKWQSSVNVFETWSLEQSSFFEIPEGYNKSVFKYLHGWTIKTPKNWSCLFTQPFGYSNQPIKSLTGIVDTDNYDGEVNAPFVIKEGFEGIIEKGTPMVQVIPIKRNNWVSQFTKKEPDEHALDIEKLWTKILGSYARNIRTPKSYK